MLLTQSVKCNQNNIHSPDKVDKLNFWVLNVPCGDFMWINLSVNHQNTLKSNKHVECISFFINFETDFYKYFKIMIDFIFIFTSNFAY